MSTNFDDVGKFHEKFGLRRVGDPGPLNIEPPVFHDLMEFRIRFLHEELSEFIAGVDSENDAQMADALIDLVYVAMGTAHLLGYPWQPLWDEVQEANMQKERAASDGSNSRRGSSFDVVKPPGWTPPRIEMILAHYGFEQYLIEAELPKCEECGGEDDKHYLNCTVWDKEDKRDNSNWGGFSNHDYGDRA